MKVFINLLLRGVSMSLERKKIVSFDRIGRSKIFEFGGLFYYIFGKISENFIGVIPIEKVDDGVFVATEEYSDICFFVPINFRFCLVDFVKKIIIPAEYIGCEDAFVFRNKFYTPLSNKCRMGFLKATQVAPVEKGVFRCDSSAFVADDICISYETEVEVVGIMT